MKILNLDLDSYKSLIFDLDGTLIDSMPIHNKGWHDAFLNHGINITTKFLKETAGLSSQRIVAIANQRFNVELNPEELTREKRDLYLTNLKDVKLVNPVLNIVKKFHNKLPLGIITGGSHEVVDQLLPILEIEYFFDHIICSDDTNLGKDTVEPYHLMCKKMGVHPKESLFFDDGEIGLKGARLAGMDVIHVDISSPNIFENPMK